MECVVDAGEICLNLEAYSLRVCESDAKPRYVDDREKTWLKKMELRGVPMNPCGAKVDFSSCEPDEERDFALLEESGAEKRGVPLVGPFPAPWDSFVLFGDATVVTKMQGDDLIDCSPEELERSLLACHARDAERVYVGGWSESELVVPPSISTGTSGGLSNVFRRMFGKLRSAAVIATRRQVAKKAAASKKAPSKKSTGRTKTKRVTKQASKKTKNDKKKTKKPKARKPKKRRKNSSQNGSGSDEDDVEDEEVGDEMDEEDPDAEEEEELDDDEDQISEMDPEVEEEEDEEETVEMFEVEDSEEEDDEEDDGEDDDEEEDEEEEVEEDEDANSETEQGTAATKSVRAKVAIFKKPELPAHRKTLVNRPTPKLSSTLKRSQISTNVPTLSVVESAARSSLNQDDSMGVTVGQDVRELVAANSPLGEIVETEYLFVRRIEWRPRKVGPLPKTTALSGFERKLLANLSPSHQIANGAFLPNDLHSLQFSDPFARKIRPYTRQIRLGLFVPETLLGSNLQLAEKYKEQ